MDKMLLLTIQAEPEEVVALMEEVIMEMVFLMVILARALLQESLDFLRAYCILAEAEVDMELVIMIIRRLLLVAMEVELVLTVMQMGIQVAEEAAVLVVISKQ